MPCSGQNYHSMRGRECSRFKSSKIGDGMAAVSIRALKLPELACGARKSLDFSSLKAG